ncbi:MAG: hypothetical protein HY830_21690 [Actinobacteria bacterium]|nr:hypothetical protein [Actinomycetota bacterium]
MTVVLDDPGVGTSQRPSAVCVVTVDDGPGGMRWALVSVNPDPALDPVAVERSRHRDAAAVLAQVADFLAAAGLENDSAATPGTTSGQADHPDPCDQS